MLRSLRRLAAKDVDTLTDSQILLLDILVYCYGRELEPEPGLRVEQIVRDADSALKRRMEQAQATMDAYAAETMTYGEWFRVLDVIRRDEALCALRIDAVAVDEYQARMATFVDHFGRAQVVYGGTGRGEWQDDCLAAYRADSPQQLKALAWFDEQVVPQRYTAVTVSGHSKGGNKAQYVVVRAGREVDRVVSFDGEGFSQEFLAAYADGIAQQAHKITAYAHKADYVNGLLAPISPVSQRFYIDGRVCAASAAYHAPYSLFAPQVEGSYVLELAGFTEQADRGRTSVRLTEYLGTLAHDDLERVCNSLGDLLDALRSLRDGENAAALATLKNVVGTEDFTLLLNTLVGFFKKSGHKVDPLSAVSVFIPPDMLPDILVKRLSSAD